MLLTAVLASAAVSLPAASATTARIHLHVRVVVGDGTSRNWVLNCNPSAGSTHPNAKRACALLNRAGMAVLAPVPRGVACTMIYGGPQRATVTGRWGSKQVKASFNRTNGCEVARWQRLIALLTLPVPSVAPGPSPSTSTVSGRVSLGPTCPVQQVGQTCEQPSVDATVTFTQGAQTRTAKATAADGFRLQLPAGLWTATANAGMHCATLTVGVPTDAPLVIACDTGIR